jgi:hypothetical protein
MHAPRTWRDDAIPERPLSPLYKREYLANDLIPVRLTPVRAKQQLVALEVPDKGYPQLGKGGNVPQLWLLLLHLTTLGLGHILLVRRLLGVSAHARASRIFVISEDRRELLLIHLSPVLAYVAAA